MPAYHLDGSAIGIEDFFSTLREQNLSPGRRVLLENQSDALRALKDTGVATLSDLVTALKSSKKLDEFAARTGLQADYLTILRRQAQSWFPQPVALSRFPGVDESLVQSLSAVGIKHSAHLVSASPDGTPADAQAHPDFSLLSSMADLVRVLGVGPVFARAFVEAGYHSVADLAAADAAALQANLSKTPALASYTGPPVTEWDLRWCIWFARLLEGTASATDPV